jgi:hypothetical protein
VTVRRVTLLLALAVATGLGAAGAVERPALPSPSAAELLATVEALTTQEMAGRRSGTAGGERAARLIADRLAATGFVPGGEAGTFFQSFVVAETPRAGAASALEVGGPGGRRLALGTEWVPHGGAPAGEVTGEVVFAGHGLADAAWDDYAGLDVRGRVVLALDGAPPGPDRAATSRLDKLVTARARGARALLLVAERLPPPAATRTPIDLVSASVTPAGADALLAPTGWSVARLGAALATGRAPRSLATGVTVRLAAALERDTVHGVNVIGVRPGRNPARAGEAVVVGAHYDHLGEVDGAIHPGADDNASGTAVVLGVARVVGAAGGLERTLVAVLFGGEELGLLGSTRYVRQPTVPLARTVAMLNFDQVGRLRQGRLFVGGVDSARGLREAVREAARRAGVGVEASGSPYAPSDHARFYAAGVPVLFFYTGHHADHHRPSDTADKVDAAGLATVARLALAALGALDAGPRPAYAGVAPSVRHHPGAGPPAGGPFLGVGAATQGAADGVRLNQVFPGSGAARAGLRDGDVLVRVGDLAVDTFDDLRAALGRRRPGDTVQVVYVRDGEPHTTSATLGARP